MSILKKSSKPEAKDIVQNLTKKTSEVIVKEEAMETDTCVQHSFLFSKNSSEVSLSAFHSCFLEIYNV